MRLHDQDRVGKWGAPGSFSLSYFVSVFSNVFITLKWLEICLQKWYSLFKGRWTWICLIQLRNVIGCADCQPTCFRSFTLSLFLYFSLSCVGGPLPCMPGVPALRRTFFYFFYFKTSIYSCVTRKSLVCTLMHPRRPRSSQSGREKSHADARLRTFSLDPTDCSWVSEDGKSRYPGALSPVLENVRRAFSLDPTDCPWISEDDSCVTRMLLVCTRMYSYVIGV